MKTNHHEWHSRRAAAQEQLRAEARREAKDIQGTLRAALAGNRKASVAMYEYMTGTPYQEPAQ